MNDERILEQLQSDHREISNAFARLEGTIVAQLSSLNDTVKELANQDKTLHERISEKDRKIDSNDKRLTVLEAKAINNRWWMATGVAFTIAVATVLAIFF